MLATDSPWSRPPLRGKREPESKQGWAGGGLLGRACAGDRGWPAEIGAEVWGAAALKPKCCGSRQPYGRVWDRVLELWLWLWLQAKAKAATMALRWRVPDSQTMGTA